MGSNEILITTAVAGFLAYNYYNDRKRIRSYKRKHIHHVVPDLHIDTVNEEMGPTMMAAHPGNLLGPVPIEIDNSNASVFVHAGLTAKAGQETMSQKEYLTGRAPAQRELSKGPPMQFSAIPWVQNRSHVAAEDFLKNREGLIPINDETEANSVYHQFWPVPKQHPYIE
jgi:hypothetical protein